MFMFLTYYDTLLAKLSFGLLDVLLGVNVSNTSNIISLKKLCQLTQGAGQCIKINASLRVMPVYRKAIGDRGGCGKSRRVEQFWEQH